MNLREQFEKSKGYNVYAYRQEYAGARAYQDGFNDEYVLWLENKLANIEQPKSDKIICGSCGSNDTTSQVAICNDCGKATCS